ncbi:amino acid-binding ACT domain protein [Corynebacterium choanae]|uniref:ACT domain-containing protein n=1 Tax=Corynebacterium choanae TaxID=1862358 RepID=A0A3G6J5J1_9CORY|nr:amino acid-binding ACT domain protein [Corynebacterium choanae]AZA13361.1 hypothetical protein CCHOA_04765 [Corynebacterium choanae]
MSYLIRVLLPDTPGSLGQLADSLGLVDANIQSVDVVSSAVDGRAVDDIVVTLPKGALPDTIITATREVPGVEVDSLRPFSGTVDRRGQIQMLSTVAQHRQNPRRAMEELVEVIPRSMTSGWGIVLDMQPHMTRVAASQAAPSDDDTHPAVVIDAPRVIDPETESWIPHRWTLLDSTLAATPIVGTSLVLVIGRPGGPEFLESEVQHLGDLGVIIGSILT